MIKSILWGYREHRNVWEYRNSSSRNTFYHLLGKETIIEVMTIHNITILIFDGKKKITLQKIFDQNYIDNKLHSSFLNKQKLKLLL